MSRIGNLGRKVHGKITKKPTNFSWVIDEELAGSGMPMSHDEFEWILKQGVSSIVTMTEDALPEDWTRRIDYLHVPTPDMGAPGIDEIDSATEFIHDQIREKKPVMVHCAAGLGRAGTILACYHVRYMGYSGLDAVEKIRRQRHGSIQSQVQETVISLYEKHVRNQS